MLRETDLSTVIAGAAHASGNRLVVVFAVDCRASRRTGGHRGRLNHRPGSDPHGSEPATSTTRPRTPTPPTVDLGRLGLFGQRLHRW
jgi:hypothetical protein